MKTVCDGLVAGPYVNLATQDRARVLWVVQPGAKARCEVVGRPGVKVELSTSPITGQSESLHKAELSGLLPGRAYRYVVSCGRQRVEGAFRTLPAKGAAAPVRFVSYSDPQGSPQRHASVAAAIGRELPFDFLSIAGDLCDDGGDWKLLQAEFFQPARDLLRKTAVWTARGNHEMEGVLFRELFALSDSPLFSFDAGNVHFVILNPYRDWRPGEAPFQAASGARMIGHSHRKSPDEMADMIARLEADLSAAKADWIIVTYHDPTFNIGGTGSEWGRKDLLPVLEKHGVDFVLCGHAHLYERCRPIGPRGGKPIIHITHAGGGGPSYAVAPSPLLEASYSGLHYCLFTIEGNKLELVAKTPAGEVLDRVVLFKTDGVYQDAVMRRAVPTATAMGLTKVFKVQRVLFDRLPEGGVAGPATILASSFPAGCQVTLEQAGGSPWQVEKLSFVACDKPVSLTVTPPVGVRLSATPWLGIFEPELRIKVTVTEGRTTSSCDGVQVLLPVDCLEKLYPVPAPVDVPPAPRSLCIDGDLADWKDVPGLFLPSARRRSDALRLTWNEDGLYGALSAKTGEIRVNAEKPWEGDCLELNFDPHNSRNLSIPRESNAGKIVLYPPAETGAGPAGVIVPLGPNLKDKQLSALWRKTDSGYDIEFFIPAATLAPAGFQNGGTITFDFLLRKGGAVVEQFIDASRLAGTWACPFFWGRLRFDRPSVRGLGIEDELTAERRAGE